MNLSSKQESAKQLKSYWEALIGQHIPTERQFLLWSVMYDQPVIERGIERVAVWYSKQRNIRQTTIHSDELVRYASGVMKAVKTSKELEVSRG